MFLLPLPFRTSLYVPNGTSHTVKRVDGKLRQPDRMTQYSSIRVTEHFFDMLIKFIQRVSTKKMEYFEGIGTWRNFPTIFHQLSDHFPSTFRPFSVNFPTKESKSTGISGRRTYILHGYILLLYHCTTLTFCIYSTTCSFVNFLNCILSTAFLRQYSVYLRNYCTVLSFASTVAPFVSTVLSFLSTF